MCHGGLAEDAAVPQGAILDAVQEAVQVVLRRV